MSNKIELVGIVVLIAIVGGFVFLSGNKESTPITGNAVAGQMQKVVLSQEGFNYKDTIVESGKPISISADSSVGGCLRSVSFNIEGKKYNKYLRTTEDTLELPSLSKGTHTFSCSMGMGFGKLIVE